MLHMIDACTILKSLHPKLFFSSCIAHLWHHCAIKAKSQFHDVDRLIAKVKAATIKNKAK